MKKILFAALAALAITSCSQNEEIEAPTQKTEINFRSVVGKSSRAAEATTENLESQGFILYAYNTKTITMDKVTAGSLTTTFINTPLKPAVLQIMPQPVLTRVSRILFRRYRQIY